LRQNRGTFNFEKVQIQEKTIVREFRFECIAIRFSQDFAAEKSATVGKEQIQPVT
jgi:hypothetical protein